VISIFNFDRKYIIDFDDFDDDEEELFPNMPIGNGGQDHEKIAT
jgi:hypothetical protein